MDVEEVRTSADALSTAQDLLDRGFPFAAHEVLEVRWKNCPDDERALWQALAQLCVAVTHAERGNAGSAAALLVRGRTALEENDGAFAPEELRPLPDLIAWCEEARRSLSRDDLLPLRITPLRLLRS